MKSSSMRFFFFATMAFCGCAAVPDAPEALLEAAPAADDDALVSEQVDVQEGIDQAAELGPAAQIELDAPTLVRRLDEIEPEACGAAEDAKSSSSSLMSPTNDLKVGDACSWCESSWTCVLSGGTVRYSGKVVLTNGVYYCSGTRGSCC